MADLTAATAWHKTQPLWQAMMARIDALPSGMRVSGTSEDFNGPFWNIVHKLVERGMTRRLAEQHAERMVSEEVMIEKRRCPRCSGPLIRRLSLRGPSKAPMGTSWYHYHCMRCGQQMQRAEIIPARPSN
jgi:DNA-directed RNA polymerase subunit RPC12/RpoP